MIYKGSLLVSTEFSNIEKNQSSKLNHLMFEKLQLFNE